MLLFYMVGPPGVGKSTVMEELTKNCDRKLKDKPFAYSTLERHGETVGIELGKRREKFSGTDALSMSVEPIARDWIGTKPHSLIMGEGARLGTIGFLSAARGVGYKVILVYLHADERTLQERRDGRGSQQSPRWMAGARTRAWRVYQRMQLDASTFWVATDGYSPQGIARSIFDTCPTLEEALA